jgi:transcriptional regulator with XRE-family HTH domain
MSMAQYVPEYNGFEVGQMRYRRIKDLREDRDFTQQKLADYLNIARSTYKNYENGVRAMPIEILSKIADYYNTSTDYLIERTNVKIPYPKK